MTIGDLAGSPREPERGRLQGRIEAFDGQSWRLYVDGGGFAHFTAADWAADGRPMLGLAVRFTPTAGRQARDVTPVHAAARRGTIGDVITLGPQRGSGRIRTEAGLVYFEAADWLGATPPTPGQPVRYTHRGRDRATRVEPESEPSP